MNQLQSAVEQLLNKKEYHPAIVELLHLILEGKMFGVERDKVLSAHNIRRISDVKEYTLPIIIDYAKICLEDGILGDNEMHNVKMLKLFFGIEEGDFYKNNLKTQVDEIIVLQLRNIYADGVVDKYEALHLGELQNLFGLSFDQFELIVNRLVSQ